MIPGEYEILKGELDINTGRETIQVSVANTGDRPIQVGSHYHFLKLTRRSSLSEPKHGGSG